MDAEITDTESAPSYTRLFWAKAHPYRQRGPERIHLLEHHLADVGASFEALLAQPTIRQRLARSGGLDALGDTAAARLAVLVTLHDIGKVNVGFQTRIWEPQHLQGDRRVRPAGHTLDLAPVLNRDDEETAGWFLDALGWWWDEALGWDSDGGETVCGLFIAALSHHGLPLQLEGKRAANPAIWRPFRGLDPADCVRRVGRLVREWFPAAWASDAPPVPSAPAFQHMFLGLCTLADWIGSNEAWFPFCDVPDDSYMDAARQSARRVVAKIGLDISDQRGTLPSGLPSFAQLFGFDPNAIQQTAALDTPLEEQLVVVESETGSGKTEAALWRFAWMYEKGLVDGLYFALPTRAAATQLHDRVTRFVRRMFPDSCLPEPVLAVPGYLQAGDITGRHLQDYVVWWDDHPDDATRGRRWAAESAKRYLAAQIAVGTVDQAMMAALKVKHAHMRAACLARNLLVVDEVHASDTYMRGILRSLLDVHLGAGGYALLMSATLGSCARRQWLSTGRSVASVLPLDEAIRSRYPAVSVAACGGESLTAVGESSREKTVCIDGVPLIQDFEWVAARALQAARDGARVLVIRNTVNYAIGTQQAVEQAATPAGRNLLFACRGTLTLHHGRFAAADRRLLDRSVEQRLGKGRTGDDGVIVIGTQTLEQSLDIDADLLISDLCPVDVLLQRIGRLHRHQRDGRPSGYAAPACVVLTPSGSDLAPLLQRGPNRNGLGPHGFVYEDLRVLEATRRLIDEHPQWDIPQMNRELVERATHPEALEAITQELGGDWLTHANSVKGGEIAEGLTASSAIIRRDRSFYADNQDVLFGSAEEHIRTRLGDEGIEINLEPAPQSPFCPGQSIDRIALPARWLPGPMVDDPIAPTIANGGFIFSISDRTFRYDRLGLRRETPAA